MLLANAKPSLIAAPVDNRQIRPYQVAHDHRCAMRLRASIAASSIVRQKQRNMDLRRDKRHSEMPAMWFDHQNQRV